ncbi:hypothetical protein [Bacteroides sp. UBA939]|uniref:hypothetical protein n=1 Tax=Bacteroides sp. UBA939 TaxID=1946092 RepID=UPI0025BFBD9F|nr:hypothetical protein [Bacteroides sp. UBA939]
MESFSQVKQRLIELCDALELTPNAFSLKIGKSRSFIKGITKEIGSDALREIYLTFPEVNILWIITGEGEKFLSSDKNISNNNNLTNYLREENKNLKEENKRLIQENAVLSARLDLYHGTIAEVAG